MHNQESFPAMKSSTWHPDLQDYNALLFTTFKLSTIVMDRKMQVYNQTFPELSRIVQNSGQKPLNSPRR